MNDDDTPEFVLRIIRARVWNAIIHLLGYVGRKSLCYRSIHRIRTVSYLNATRHKQNTVTMRLTCEYIDS